MKIMNHLSLTNGNKFLRSNTKTNSSYDGKNTGWVYMDK